MQSQTSFSPRLLRCGIATKEALDGALTLRYKPGMSSPSLLGKGKARRAVLQIRH